ncbi:MAG: selenocysteine-specific translation elongation factor [Planctomycetaceae bacterium]|nr:selenocysteine-specific translation elongation factor [Planctomycetaceae bacterium]
MPADLILGTAGHVDHGKTSLIRALTGIDTDRLPEEKRRGITIDLGFAHLSLGDYRLGIVDVPGHERFIRNMLAGATGMDLAMLIVAADEGVKEQTREHLDILQLLDLRGGVIVVTKADLAASDWTELVEAEIRELVRGTVLADAAIVRTSTVSGLGLDRLRDELTRAAGQAVHELTGEPDAPFRLAIDRSFSIAGHGTVVTGSVASGRARIGDNLVIEPGGMEVRVRGLEHHDSAVDEVRRGQRAAINLAGIHHDAVRRGQELATPGHLLLGRLLTAQISLLNDAPQLRSRTRLRVHLGTAEVLATAALLDRSSIKPGESAPVQLYLAQPVVAVWNQPLVIRSESPMRTIGGGRVLEPNAARLRRPDECTLKRIAALRSGEAVERAAASLYLAGWRGWQPADLPRLAGAGVDDAITRTLAGRGELLEIRVSPTRSVRVHRQTLERAGYQIVEFLEKLHDRQPLKTAFPKSAVYAGFAWLGEPSVIDAVLAQLQAGGQIREQPGGVAVAGRGPKLSRGEQSLLADLLSWFRASGVNSLGLAQCQDRAAKNRAAVAQLLTLATEAGDLVQVAQDYWLHADVERQARQKVAAGFAQGGFTVSQLRELLGTTRKYAVPLCEYWDRMGFTVRSGDIRKVQAT